MLTCNSSELCRTCNIYFPIACFGLFPIFFFSNYSEWTSCAQGIVNNHAIEQLPPGSSFASAPQDSLRQLQRELSHEADSRCCGLVDFLQVY